MNLIKITHSSEFFNVLFQIDKDFFEQDKSSTPCPQCGNKLDASNYMRKPRGGNFHSDLSLRFSLCCRQDGCRRRYLPPSIRFYKGFVHWPPWVLLAANFISPASFRRKRLMKLFSVSYRTIRRWEDYWKDVFPQSVLFKILKAIIPTDDNLVKAIFKLNLNCIDLLQLFRDSIRQT